MDTYLRILFILLILFSKYSAKRPETSIDFLKRNAALLQQTNKNISQQSQRQSESFSLVSSALTNDDFVSSTSKLLFKHSNIKNNSHVVTSPGTKEVPSSMIKPQKTEMQSSSSWSFNTAVMQTSAKPLQSPISPSLSDASSLILSSPLTIFHSKSSMENVISETYVHHNSSILSSSVVSASSPIENSSSFTMSTPVLPSSCTIIVKSETICKSTQIYSTHTTQIYLSSHSAINSSSKIMNSTKVSSQTETTQMKSLITSILSPSTANISKSTKVVFPSTIISPSSSIITRMSAYVINPSLDTCDAVASNFSIVLKNYTSCILNNLHPMEICFECFHEYETMHDYHRKVYHDCGERLIGNYNSRYQVIAQLFQIQQETWNSLQCEKCYNRNPQSPTISTQFQQFKRLYKDVKNCFHLHKNSGNETVNGNSKNKTVCTQCSSLYNEFQSTFKFQEDSEENTDTLWCADINVAVNETRHMWSGRFHCGEKEKDLVSIIALTCFFCFLPIVFYVGAKLHADVKERKTNRYYDSE